MNNHYNKAYIPIYNQQNMYEQNLYDQIDGQINQLVNMRNQIKSNQQQTTQQPTAINQTFQLSPNGGGMKYANSIEDVANETVFFDTPYFSKDLSVLWIKNAGGDIKAYELNEIIQKDEKDLQIELLTAKINELEGRINDEQYNSNVIQPEIETSTTRDDEAIRTTTKENKSTSISRVSKSKTK